MLENNFTHCEQLLTMNNFYPVKFFKIHESLLIHANLIPIRNMLEVRFRKIQTQIVEDAIVVTAEITIIKITEAYLSHL